MQRPKMSYVKGTAAVGIVCLALGYMIAKKDIIRNYFSPRPAVIKAEKSAEYHALTIDEMKRYVPKGWEPVSGMRLKTKSGEISVVGANNYNMPDSQIFYISKGGVKSAKLERRHVTEIQAEDLDKNGFPEIIVISANSMGSRLYGVDYVDVYSGDFRRLNKEGIVRSAKIEHENRKYFVSLYHPQPEFYFFDGAAVKRDYDQERTISHVSREARKWSHYLYEDRPEEFYRQVREFAGNETIAELAMRKTIRELNDEAIARVIAAAEIQELLQAPLLYGGTRFIQEFGRLWEKEKYMGITQDSQGNYLLDIGSRSQREFRTKEDARQYRDRQEAQKNAPSYEHTYETRNYDSRSGTTNIGKEHVIGGQPKTPQQWETERAIKKDPAIQFGRRAAERAGQLFDSITKPQERPAEGQRTERPSERQQPKPQMPDVGKALEGILRRR